MKSRALLEARINSEYSRRFEKFGPTAKGVFWASTARQEKRFEMILKEIQKISQNCIVLEIADIGCGYGSFVHYLNKHVNHTKFNYDGFDINPKFIEYCRSKFSGANLKFVIGSRPSSKKDFITISGTYNLATTTNVSLWEHYLFSCLSKCWANTKIAMIFNLQTANEKKISSQNIYYAKTSEIIDYCVANFGPTRILRDDQLKNDVTFTVVR
ncbi:class I SAM-dependent methyltransferase [Paracoccaceae bacterium]|nr:class I SAM-dependent methyltransferase [Paracoccaceae bacterium]